MMLTNKIRCNILEPRFSRNQKTKYFFSQNNNKRKVIRNKWWRNLLPVFVKSLHASKALTLAWYHHDLEDKADRYPSDFIFFFFFNDKRHWTIIRRRSNNKRIHIHDFQDRFTIPLHDFTNSSYSESSWKECCCIIREIDIISPFVDSTEQCWKGKPTRNLVYLNKLIFSEQFGVDSPAGWQSSINVLKWRQEIMNY